MLTFEEYLDVYVPYLAGKNTRHVPTLVDLIPSNPRMIAPFLMWCVKTNQVPYTKRSLVSLQLPVYFKSTPEDFIRELETVEMLNDRGELEEYLDKESTLLRPEYSKCWRSFKCRRDYPENFTHERG